MKQRNLTLAFWIFAFMVSSLLLGIPYELFYFRKSLVLGLIVIIGGLFIKINLPSVLERPKPGRVVKLCLLLVSVYFLVMFLTVVGSGFASAEYISYGYRTLKAPGFPIFDHAYNFLLVGTSILISALDWWLTRYLRKKLPQDPAKITFTSSRKPVTLFLSEIVFVESNDNETLVYASDGQKYRNITAISQWERLLGMDFVRIHRSYLVARMHISRVDNDTIVMDDGHELPISLKYRGSVRKDNTSRSK